MLKEGDESVPATLQNLSLAGIGCTCSREFTLGRSLSVLLELPAEDEQERLSWTIPVQVVRCLRQRQATARPRFQLGLVFGELAPEQKESIAAFMDRCSLVSPIDP